MNGGTLNTVRIGVLRLADSAPVALALHDGLFAALGLDARCVVEPSWANIADKLAYGLLDAAVMLPPLALAGALGLRRPATRVLVPMGLSVGGNTVVLARDPAEAVGDGPALERGERLVAWCRRQPEPPAIAVVHLLSTHNLLLRHWIAAAGGDPDRDFRTVVVPPAGVVAALAERRIMGFCAGAPWGDFAASRGVGQVVLGTSEIWPRHPEKCLAVAAGWAESRPAALDALLRALLRAGATCDDPAEAPRIAALLAATPYLLAEHSTLATLPGGDGVERMGFRAPAAWHAAPAHGRWFAAQMARWGWLDHAVDTAAAVAATFRPDLLDRAAAEEGFDPSLREDAEHRAAMTGPHWAEYATQK